MAKQAEPELSWAPTRLIVNLAAVSRIDTSDVDALASAAVAVEADHAICLVDGEAGRVHAALAAERVTNLFEIFSSVSEAVQNSGRPTCSVSGGSQWVTTFRYTRSYRIHNVVLLYW
jgi:hypothetical protein